MVVLDASVLIGFLDGDDADHARATALLLSNVDEELATSVVTLAEVLVGPMRRGHERLVLQAVHDLEIRSVPLSDVALDLARVHTDTGLRMSDCCVLLAAMTADAAVATFDTALAEAATRAGLPLTSADPRQAGPAPDAD